LNFGLSDKSVYKWVCSLLKHHSSDAKHLDAKHLDSRHLDSKHLDARHLDAKHLDAKHLDAKHLDARHLDARHLDAKHLDAKHLDARHLNARHLDAKHLDAKHLNAKHEPIQKKSRILLGFLILNYNLRQFKLLFWEPSVDKNYINKSEKLALNFYVEFFLPNLYTFL